MIRRDFLKAMFAAAAAPAIVKASALMKIAPPAGYEAVLTESGLYTQSGLQLATTELSAESINFRAEAANKLAEWYAERLDQLMMATLTGRPLPRSRIAADPFRDQFRGIGGPGGPG